MTYVLFVFSVKKTLLTEHDVNYIGELQNLCMSLSLVLPSYEYAHDKNMFTVKCLLYGYITMGMHLQETIVIDGIYQ